MRGGPAANMLDVSPRNAANISVMAVNGRVYALFEGGQPHELDPETLQTLGVTTFNGLLQVGAPFNMDWIGLSGTAGSVLSILRKARGLKPSKVTLGGDSFASHFRRDHHRSRIVSMSFQVAVRILLIVRLMGSKIQVYVLHSPGTHGLTCAGRAARQQLWLPDIFALLRDDR